MDNIFTFPRFEELNPYDQNQNYLHLMRAVSNEIIDQTDNSQQFQALIELRRMRKFQNDLFNLTFSNVIDSFIDNYLLSKEEMQVLHSLVLCSEIFSRYYFDFNDSWIPRLLRNVIKLSINSNERVEKYANEALNNLAGNMFYQRTLECLFSLLGEEENKIAEKAYNILSELIVNISNIPLINEFDWTEIYGIISENFSKILNANPPSNYPLRVSSIFNSMKEKLQGDWDSFLSTLTQENAELTMKILDGNQIYK